MSNPAVLVSCGILRQEIERLGDPVLGPIRRHYLSRDLHRDPSRLEKALVGAIDYFRNKNYGPMVVVYGDLCLGLDRRMKNLIQGMGATKVDALNCLDCFMGGEGRLLEIDPDHNLLFLNPAFIRWEKPRLASKAENRQRYAMLKGIVLMDTLGDLDRFADRIAECSDWTGLPVLDRLDVGLDGLKKVLTEALARAHRETP